MQDIVKYVGKQIKKYRLLRGLTQKELGLLIGVKHNTISSYETGLNEPDQNILFAIANALKVSINDFFPNPFNDKESGSLYTVETGKLVMLPVVGDVSCGNGVIAYEVIEGYEPTPREWLNGGEDYFYLRAKGNSMIGARIHDGDLLLIRKQSVVEDGEIAVILFNDEAVLKRLYRSEDRLVLQSENPDYPPIIVSPAEIKIIGKLKKVIINY